jgi:hypothetical protein
LLGELFGWEFAPGVPARERSAPAIYDQLVPRALACDPARGDLRALAPSAEVNRCLQRLVAIVQGESERAHYPIEAVQSPEFTRELSGQLVQRIHARSELRERARELRQIAATAETALEYHFSRRLLGLLRQRQDTLPTAAPGPARTQQLEQCLTDFPYTHNYLQLMAAEVALLELQPVPQVLRDRELCALPASARREFLTRRERLRAFAQQQGSALPLSQQTIAVCGCGPLPISGLMLHTWTGARVVLIDRDPSSVDAARAWVRELTRIGVLEEGAVCVQQADVSQLEFVTRHVASDSHGARLHCDVMLVASLVDGAAKLELARKLRSGEEPAPHTLLLRSAGGLCAELAYEAVDTHAVNDVRLPFCGESLPRGQVCIGMDAQLAARSGITSDESSELLFIAHRHVLNSTEVYRRLSLSQEQVSELAVLERWLYAALATRTHLL